MRPVAASLLVVKNSWRLKVVKKIYIVVICLYLFLEYLLNTLKHKDFQNICFSFALIQLYVIHSQTFVFGSRVFSHMCLGSQEGKAFWRIKGFSGRGDTGAGLEYRVTGER